MELKLTSEIDLLSFCVATKQKQVYNLQTSIVDQCDFINMYKGQPGACSSRLRRVQGRVRPLWVYSTQPFPTFL